MRAILMKKRLEGTQSILVDGLGLFNQSPGTPGKVFRWSVIFLNI